MPTRRTPKKNDSTSPHAVTESQNSEKAVVSESENESVSSDESYYSAEEGENNPYWLKARGSYFFAASFTDCCEDFKEMPPVAKALAVIGVLVCVAALITIFTVPGLAVPISLGVVGALSILIANLFQPKHNKKSCSSSNQENATQAKPEKPQPSKIIWRFFTRNNSAQRNDRGQFSEDGMPPGKNEC